MQGELGSLSLLLLPERPEVLRLLGERLYLIGREAYLHMVLIGLTVELQRQAQVAETGFLGGSHIDLGATILQRRGASLIGRQQVGTYLPLHHTIARDAILIELHFDGGLLARLIEPIGMVGDGHPQVVATVRIILGLQHVTAEEQEEKSNKNLFHRFQ